MDTVSASLTEHQPAAPHQHVAPEGFIRKYVFSLDHKVIGKQYHGWRCIAVLTGMVLSWIMRYHLAYPDNPFRSQVVALAFAAGGVMTPEYYLQLMTMHGTIMVFFVLTTAPFAGFGNFILAAADRRGGHGVSAIQHDVVLGRRSSPSWCWWRRFSFLTARRYRVGPRTRR